ncbi:6488_t:CDS:1, partial [Dentiscutata heterogama]
MAENQTFKEFMNAINVPYSSTMKIENALNYVIGYSNAKNIFGTLPDTSIHAQVIKLTVDPSSIVNRKITNDKLFDIKSATIYPVSTELSNLRHSSGGFDNLVPTIVKIMINNPRLTNMKIIVEIKHTANDGSNYECTWEPDILKVFQERSVHDYLLNTKVPRESWSTLNLNTLLNIMMPKLSGLSKLFPLPLESISLLNRMINRELSEIDFLFGLTKSSVIVRKAKLVLNSEMMNTSIKLDATEISKLMNLKVTITGLDTDKQNIEFEASAMIKDLEVKVFTHNEYEQFISIKFKNGTLLSKIVTTMLDASKIKMFDYLTVPLHNITLNDFLRINKNIEFGMSFSPVTEQQPTMDYKLKNIYIISNNNNISRTWLSQLPSQIKPLENLNETIKILIYDPLDITKLSVGLEIKFYIPIKDTSINLSAKLTYQPITPEQYIITIESQNSDKPLTIEQLLQSLSLHDTFIKLKEFAPVIWNNIFKQVKSIEFQCLILQIQKLSNEQ